MYTGTSSRALLRRAILAVAVLLVGGSASAEERLEFYTVTPCRVLPKTQIWSGDESVPFPIKGLCGVPLGAKAVAVNLAVTDTNKENGHLIVYDADGPQPGVSHIHWSQLLASGQAVTNGAIIPLLYGGGSVQVWFPSSGGGASKYAYLIIDVSGYFK